MQKLTKFGVEVKKALVERGMTQAQLASEVGTSRKYLHLIMRGARPRSKYIVPIAEYLNLDLKKIG